MTRSQKQQYQMLVRLRDFGATHRELFPESSPAGQVFAAIAAAVAAIDQYLARRVRARAEGQRVNPGTRDAVLTSLKAIAGTARRISFAVPDINPFQLPRRRSFSTMIATGRAFIVEADKRQAEFVKLGMPATFVADFTSAVDALEQAVTLQINSRTLRLDAQAHLEHALDDGLHLVGDLDTILGNSLRPNPALLATYRGARRIGGTQPPAAQAPSVPADAATAAAGPSAHPADRAGAAAEELPKAS